MTEERDRNLPVQYEEKKNSPMGTSTLVRTLEKIKWEVDPAKAFLQLGILVLDGSGSMENLGETGESKNFEVHRAVKDLIPQLKKSKLRDLFRLSILTYDNTVIEKLPLSLIHAIDETLLGLPMEEHGGATAIGDALEKAYEIGKHFLSEADEENRRRQPRSVVIVIMTDGQNNVGKDPVMVSRMIKMDRSFRITAAGYGMDDDLDMELLGQIVSPPPNNLKRTSDPEELRKFFEASVTTTTWAR